MSSNELLSASVPIEIVDLTALFVLNLLKEVHFICLKPGSYYFSITLIMANYECNKLNISIFIK